MAANVLGSRDTNAQIKPTPSPEKDKPKSLDYHRQVLNSRLNTEQYAPMRPCESAIANSQIGPSSLSHRRTRSSLLRLKSCRPSRPSMP